VVFNAVHVLLKVPEHVSDCHCCLNSVVFLFSLSFRVEWPYLSLFLLIVAGFLGQIGDLHYLITGSLHSLQIGYFHEYQKVQSTDEDTLCMSCCLQVDGP
jgi:hypothetical protein